MLKDAEWWGQKQIHVITASIMFEPPGDRQQGLGSYAWYKDKDFHNWGDCEESEAMDIAFLLAQTVSKNGLLSTSDLAGTKAKQSNSNGCTFQSGSVLLAWSTSSFFDLVLLWSSVSTFPSPFLFFLFSLPLPLPLPFSCHSSFFYSSFF